MGYASRKNKEESQYRVLAICPTTEVEKEFNAFAHRTATMLEMVRKFMDETCDLDENDPELTSKMIPVVEGFIFDLVTNYPTPDHLDVDIETLRQVKILAK